MIRKRYTRTGDGRGRAISVAVIWRINTIWIWRGPLTAINYWFVGLNNVHMVYSSLADGYAMCYGSMVVMLTRAARHFMIKAMMRRALSLAGCLFQASGGWRN